MDSRFTLVVEDVCDKGSQGLAVSGYVRGQLRVGDEMYMHFPRVSHELGMATKMENASEQVIASAKDENVTLYFEGVKLEDIPKYAVISNVVSEEDIENEVYNPAVAGLMSNFKKHQSNQAYYQLLLYQIVNGTYYVPMFLDEDGKASVAAREASIEDSLKAMTITHANGYTAIPIFTDSDNLKKWEKHFGNNQDAKITIFPFSKVLSFSKAQGQGVVVDAFDSSFLYLPKELVEQMQAPEPSDNKFFVETERLYIRPLQYQDAKAFVELAADGSLVDVGFDPMCGSWMNNWILEAMQLTDRNDPSKDYLAYAICQKDSDTVIGSVGCTYYEDLKQVGITYFIGGAHRKNGYGAEAVHAYTDYFFEHYDVTKLIATIRETNIASWKCIQKAGYDMIERKVYKDINDEKAQIYYFYEANKSE